MRAAAAVLMILLMTACGPLGSDDPRSGSLSAAVKESPGSSKQLKGQGADSQTCQFPRPYLAVNGHKVARISSRHVQQDQLTVQVGDQLHVVATGNCAGTVTGSPQSGHLRTMWDRSGHVQPTYFRAATQGTARLIVSMPMCAKPLNSTGARCLGGISTLGTFLVTVRGTPVSS